MSGTQRTGFTDAALVRLLAGLSPGSPAATPGAATGFIDQLSAWLRWTDAPPLFAALQEPLTIPPLADDEDASPDSAEADCRSVHTLLLRALAEDIPWRPRPLPRVRGGAGWSPAAVLEPLDLPAYRHHYQAQQHLMEERITPLRARLRRVLQLRSPALARLAALDEVMERVLNEPERRQLAGLTAVLEKRYALLCTEGEAAQAATPDTPPAWHTRFQQELQALLLAELDLRWHPINGLLAALHTPG